MIAVPADDPKRNPDDKPIVATAELLVVHVPPPVPLSVVDANTHNEYGPVIADGSGLTVTTIVEAQPVPRAYVITEVPEVTPITTPVDDETVATDVLPLVHVPPPELLSVVVAPVQTLAVPVMAGVEIIVTVCVALPPATV